MKLSILFNFIFLINFTTGNPYPNLSKPLNIAISAVMGSRSHTKYLLEISEILTNRGHNITYLCSKGTLEFSTGYNVTNLIVSDAKQELVTFDWKPYTKKSSPTSFSGQFGNIVLEAYAKSFPNYEKYYRSQKSDLIICDFFSLGCIDSAAKFSIPMIIGYQSLNLEGRKPYLTSSYGLNPTSTEKYTFWQRFYHGIIEPVKKFIQRYEFLDNLKRIRKENEVPRSLSVFQFMNMGLKVANSFIGFENPRSLSSHIYPIGPILTENLPSLNSDLQSFFESHKKILYIAFGSYIKFKKELSSNLLEHFQKLLNQGWIDGIVWGSMANINLEEFPKSYTVDNIEYSTDSILNGSHQNFKILNWAPQEAILNHPHTKLFITHGGLDSIQESIQSGTPMLAIPHFGDQPRNAVRIEELGIGDYIEWPLDGDTIISQKLVNLLDPSNNDLKAKLEQFQRISKFSSNRKYFAADLIETYAYSAKTCRAIESPKSFEIPCEVKPFLPLDEQISFIKANLIDVYFVSILLFFIAVTLILFSVFKVSSKILKSYNKKRLNN
ncbi:glycosyltransferase family 1 protein [Conidiobolus coronatus NRRL 28638]|uniref:Glycosyltransferase family 1 protein n=1 Tax=Conidiobolus coronatus (strain ATCC 28846 / CBS 209.66 / NRRL 28638) TaxID=796925 RepID=A0A137P198_CONC2|nr:glycosyltransferase family 1 protein [Conidiobolus coronatus NRRL 28638]|eukprot:KXN68649.1 glycosyltransferase family 1 protein [Conidiobolus coronatus NRRL 28638]